MDSFENYSSMESRLLDLERKLEEARHPAPSLGYSPMFPLPQYSPQSFPMYSEPPSFPGMMPSLPPNLSPDEMKLYLHQQAQLLEQAAQRVRSEQSNSHLIDYYQRENSRLLQELERLRQATTSPARSPESIAQINDLQEEIVRLRSEFASSQERRSRLEYQLQEANIRIRSLEQESSRLQQELRETLHEKAPPQFEAAELKKEEIQKAKNLYLSHEYDDTEKNYVPVRTQVNVSENVSQLLNWDEPSQNPQVQCAVLEGNKVLGNIEQKLLDLQLEREKLDSEYSRVCSSPRTNWSLKRKEDLELELEILCSNISRLKSKLRSYS